jgi:4-hydroxy-3-polyprenylbenzoate decarboxylase
VISPSGEQVLRHELNVKLNRDAWSLSQLFPDGPLPAELTAEIQLHGPMDYFSPIASGSYLTAGMVVCPCSGGTLSGIAHGTSSNLIQRAADVHLKERRPLILVPRETPVSLVHLDNMRKAHRAGAVILPASPGWYHPKMTVSDLVDFVVARILDQLQIPHGLSARWNPPQ